jgi:EAL and modified HD-GYP domain-containing signal transduction protein
LLISHYQGYYFAKPEVLSMKRIDPSMQHLMQLFGLVSSHAEPKVIDAGFRQDVVLSYNLLRYINSVGFGLLHKVDTIRHALVVLGHAKLARWLTLLMFSGSSSNPSPQALFRMALIRARLMELLGRACLPAADHDDLFMSGMFSLLDAMLDTPLEELLKHVSLPEKVSAALLQQQGPFLPYLELSKACEENDLDRLRNLAEPLGVSLEDVTRAQMEAMAWAEDMAGAGPG